MVSDKELRLMAKKRVEFRQHIIVYIIINAMLFFINILSSPGTYWFYWITLFWGVGVAFHYMDAYHGEGGKSEEREYQKLKAEMKKKK